MEMARGRVIATCMPRHRHQELSRFLELIDAQTPKDFDLHVIADNFSAHKHPKVTRWINHHPRFHKHYTPTRSSWLNVIERFFRDLTDKRLRRGAFRSVDQLVATRMSRHATTSRSPSSGPRPPKRSSRRSAACALR